MAEQDFRRFLNPHVVSKLAGLELKARLVVEGFVTGMHKGPYRGFSVEFAQHRPYMPGDPLKHIDWNLYAKSDRFFVKEFEEETNLRAYLVLDASRTMAYGTQGITKLEYSSCLAASLAYLMLRQHDSVGLLVFDTEPRVFVPPRARSTHLHAILRVLDETKADNQTRLTSIFHMLASRIKRRGLIIILSDLHHEAAGDLVAALKHLRHMKHEVIVFHVLDPAEVELFNQPETVLEDMETRERIRTHPAEIRGGYTADVTSWRERLGDACRASMIDYVPLDTGTTFDKALLGYLTKREQLR